MRKQQLGTMGSFRDGYTVHARVNGVTVKISGELEFRLKSEAQSWAFGYIAGLRAAGRKPEGGVYEW